MHPLMVPCGHFDALREANDGVEGTAATSSKESADGKSANFAVSHTFG
jgi:hypothetical protein